MYGIHWTAEGTVLQARQEGSDTLCSDWICWVQARGKCLERNGKRSLGQVEAHAKDLKDVGNKLLQR